MVLMGGRSWCGEENADKISKPAFQPACGAIAQLGERIVRNDEVVGSIPTSSTIFSITYSVAKDQSCPILSQKIQLASVFASIHRMRKSPRAPRKQKINFLMPSVFRFVLLEFHCRSKVNNFSTLATGSLNVTMV